MWSVSTGYGSKFEYVCRGDGVWGCMYVYACPAIMGYEFRRGMELKLGPENEASNSATLENWSRTHGHIQWEGCCTVCLYPSL